MKSEGLNDESQNCQIPQFALQQFAKFWSKHVPVEQKLRVWATDRTMDTSVAMFSTLICAAGRTVRTGTLSCRAVTVGVRRPLSTAFRVLPGLHKTKTLVSGNN